MFNLPKPHGDKLNSLLVNTKLPESDKPNVEHAIERYEDWISRLTAVEGSYDDIIRQMAALLNEYKNYIDVELISTATRIFCTDKRANLNSTTLSWRNLSPLWSQRYFPKN